MTEANNVKTGTKQMSVGKQIFRIRSEQKLTQEEFGKLFHVTRQTVSHWENEKSYPDLQTLVTMSDMFQIALDVILKEDGRMVKTIDRERAYGTCKREKAVIDFLMGAGTGLIISCLFSPDSMRRTVVIIAALSMIAVGWFKQAKYDRKVMEWMERQAPEDKI